jgi:hypothetical protein
MARAAALHPLVIPAKSLPRTRSGAGTQRLSSQRGLTTPPPYWNRICFPFTSYYHIGSGRSDDRPPLPVPAKPESKTARLTLLVDPRKKALLEEICAAQDLTPSQVVRRLIREYIIEHAGDRPLPTWLLAASRGKSAASGRKKP